MPRNGRRLIAIANEGRTLHSQPLLNSPGQATLPLIYGLPQSDFNDITVGTNQVGIPATPGYDLVTGRGTPVANQIIGDLGTWAPTRGTVQASLADAHGNNFEVMQNGAIWELSAGHWTEIGQWPAGTSTTISAISVGTNGSLYALASNNTVYQYSGAGNTWNALPISAANVSSFSIAPDGGVYALATNGTVYQYSGSGNMWNALPIADAQRQLVQRRAGRCRVCPRDQWHGLRVLGNGQ